MEADDSKRNQRGVICTLVKRPDGQVRLVMDDASSSTSTAPQCWQSDRLFTWQTFPEHEFLTIELSEKELSEIGLALVARLAVFENGAKQRR